MHDEHRSRIGAARTELRRLANGELAEDGDPVTLTEASRRLGVALGASGRKVRAFGIPLGSVRNRRPVRWAAPSAAFELPPGFVAIGEVAEREGGGFAEVLSPPRQTRDRRALPRLQ